MLLKSDWKSDNKVLNVREAYCHHCISFEILFGFGAAGEKISTSTFQNRYGEYGTNGSSIRKASNQKAFEQRCYER